MKPAAMMSAAILLAAATAAAEEPSCALIEGATSANEDFVEVALAGEKAVATASLASVHDRFAKIEAALPAAAATRAAAQIGTIDAAVAGGNLPGAAVAAVEVYRTLVESFERRLPTTLEVALLDYAGFRLQGLLATSPTDWNAIAATIDESSGNWSNARKRVTDKALRDLVDDVQAGLAGAAAAGDAAWLAADAQILLDAVDLLEHAVESTVAGACK